MYNLKMQKISEKMNVQWIKIKYNINISRLKIKIINQEKMMIVHQC